MSSHNIFSHLIFSESIALPVGASEIMARKEKIGLPVYLISSCVSSYHCHSPHLIHDGESGQEGVGVTAIL